MYQDLKAHREVCKNDTLHMVAGRTVQFYTKKLVSFLQELDYNHLLQGIVQNSSGKVWMSNDWRPEHLRLIYDFYQDNIVNPVSYTHLTLPTTSRV